MYDLFEEVSGIFELLTGVAVDFGFGVAETLTFASSAGFELVVLAPIDQQLAPKATVTVNAINLSRFILTQYLSSSNSATIRWAAFMWSFMYSSRSMNGILSRIAA